MNSTLVKCRCNNCSAEIEFEAQQASETVACPSCGLDTVLYLPAKNRSPQPQSAPLQIEQIPIAQPQSAPRRSLVSVGGIVVLAIAGLAFIYSGCTVHTETSIHQIFAALQYCTGWILLGLALVIEALRSISKNQ